MHSIDWDDLRYALAVAQEGSLAGAARSLGVSHTTVLRRLAAFEARLGVRLFERLAAGYGLTAAGEELVGEARAIDRTIAALERRLAGRDLQLSGTVRVTTTDTLMASVLPGVLGSFRATHPGIQVEVSISNAMATLTRREADVAIRPAAPPSDALVGRRVSAIAFALYAAPAYLASLPAASDLAAFAWVGPDDSLRETGAARWMRDALPSMVPALRTDSLLALRDAATAGLGVAVLPCYLGDTSPGLARVRAEPISDLASELWVLTHEDLRRSARVRAFTQAVSNALAGSKSLFEGVAPSRTVPL